MIEQYDSASFMLRANARYLHGQDFGVWETIPYGIPPRMFRPIISGLNLLPERKKIGLSVQVSTMQAIDSDEALQLNEEQIARSIVDQYPEGQYQAIAIGSSNGSLTHLYAALGIPWLPQTNLLLFNRPKPIEPDNLIADAVWGAAFADKMLARNPTIRAYQMNDPAQDRFMAIKMAYFRLKFISLPRSYKEFIEKNLAPGGTILIIDCQYHWPGSKTSDRHSFQVGGYGGTTLEEYADGGPRVESFLKRNGSPRRSFVVPKVNTQQLEAEWGYDPDLTESITTLARDRGYKVESLSFDTPDDPVVPVAEFYAWWYRQLGWKPDTLLIESFMLLDPYSCLRAGCIPYWAVFNAQPSYDLIHRYLDRRPFDNIYMTIFSNIVESIGVPKPAEWDTILKRAAKDSGYIGVDISKFPYDLGTTFYFFEDIKKLLPARYNLPKPVELDVFRQFLREHGSGELRLNGV